MKISSKKICLAALFFLSFLSGHSQSAQEWIEKGKDYYRRDLPDSSRKAYEMAFKSTDGEIQLAAVEGLVKVALLRSEMKRADSLIRMGDNILDQEEISTSPKCRFLLIKGEFLRKNSRFEEALRQHKELIGLATDPLLRADALFYTALTHERLSNYDSSLLYVDRAYQIYRQELDSSDSRLSSIYNGMGVCYYRAHKLDEAKKYYLKAKDIAELQSGSRSSDLAYCLSNLAGISRAEEDYAQAIEYTQTSLDIFKHLQDPGGISSDYYSLGVYHYFLGEYGQTRDYLRACLDMRRDIYPSKHYRLINPLQVLAITFEESGKYAEALEIQEEVLSITLANYGPNSLDAAFAFENKAITLKILGQLDSALSYIKKAQSILPNFLSPDDYALAINAYNYADILYQRGAFAPALDQLQRSYRIIRANGRLGSKEYAQNLSLEAKILVENGKWEKARETFEAAMKIAGIDFDSSPTRGLTPTSLSIFHDYSAFLFKKYQHSGKEEDLREFYQKSRYFLEVSDRLRLQALDPYTRSILSRDNALNFQQNVGIYHMLYRQLGDPTYLEEAYRFSEYGRSSMLRDLQSERIASYAGLPDSVLKRDRSLRQSMSRLNEEVRTYPDSVELREALIEAREELKAYLDFARESYPRYFEFRYESQVPSLEAIQESLSEGENLIQYTEDDTAYYALVLSKKVKEMFYLGEKEKINPAIFAWRKGIMARNKAWQEPGTYLYQSLWKPLEDAFNGKRVVIVPTGPIFYLNFEALPGKEEKFLIEAYNLSYALSFSLWQAREKEAQRGGILAVAPGFEDEIKTAYLRSLDSLDRVDEGYMRTLRQPWSLAYVKKMRRKIAQKTLIGLDASEANVKAHLARNRVIYLGTHAIADASDPLRSRLLLAKDPELSSEDGYLHAYEIFSIPMQADLAVLSACESGLGKLEEGEGMISLSYSLHYAGCASTVLSLWKLDEKSSTKLAESFFNYLGKGYSKSQALRKAKLHYLENQKGPLQHPFFWSGMVLMGKDGQLDIYSEIPWRFWFLAALGILLFVSVLQFRLRS